VWKKSHGGPKDVFVFFNIGFWPTSIPWKTRELSTARLDVTLVFHSSSSCSSLFRVTLRRLFRAGGGEPHHAGKVRHLLIIVPSLYILHHLFLSPLFFPCQVSLGNSDGDGGGGC
jgi:hypothetical protein